MSKFLETWLGNEGERPVGRSPLTLRSNKWDRLDIERLVESVPDFRKEVQALWDSVETGKGAAHDAFLSFYKGDPEPLDQFAIRPDHLVNAHVRDTLVGMKEWTELREVGGTVGNDLASAMSFMSMRPDIEGIFDRLKSQQDLANQLQQKQDELEQAQQENQDPDDAAQQMMDQMQQQIDQMRQDLEQQLQDAQTETAAGLRQGLRNASEDTQDLNAAATAFGSHAGSVTRVDGATRLALARKMKDNDKLKKIANRIGPMLAYMYGERRRKISSSKEEVFDVEMGADIARALPSELMAIRHPILRRWFQKNYIEQTLLQSKMRGDDKVGMGAIICAIDSSGSMSGDRETWAKAVAISLLHLARTQNREFLGILFSGPGQTLEFPFLTKEDCTPERIMEFAETFVGGGTSYQDPLTLSVAHLRKQYEAAGQLKGDIVFISDEECAVPDPWFEDFKAEQEELGFQVLGVSVAGGYRSSYNPAWGGDFYRICDNKVATIADLSNTEAGLGTVFQGIREP